MQEQIIKKTEDTNNSLENIEVVGDIVETVIENEEIAEGCGEFIGDILDSTDDLPVLAIIGIITGIVTAIGGVIFAITKFKKK